MSRRALALFALVLAATPAARAQTITVRPGGDLSSLVGTPFDVPIIADWSGRPDKLGSFAVTLRWDAAVLRFDIGTPGSFGTLESNTDSAAFGVLKLAGANPAGATGLITLGVGRFTPLTAATTAVTLQLGDIFSSAPDFANLFGSTDVQSGLFCPARGHWGDPGCLLALERCQRARDSARRARRPGRSGERRGDRQERPARQRYRDDDGRRPTLDPSRQCACRERRQPARHSRVSVRLVGRSEQLRVRRGYGRRAAGAVR
jgi:hypothetical protein